MNQELQKQISEAAGKLAQIAGIITGETLTGPSCSCPVMHLPDLLVALKDATNVYNKLIMKQVIGRDSNPIRNSNCEEE